MTVNQGCDHYYNLPAKVYILIFCENCRISHHPNGDGDGDGDDYGDGDGDGDGVGVGDGDGGGDGEW